MEFTLLLRLFMWVYPNAKHSSYGRSECLIRQEQPEWSFRRHFTSKKEFDFNNISAISRRSALMCWGNRSTQRKPPTCLKSLTNFIAYCCIEYTSPSARIELTTLVVICSDCTGRFKSNYHMITTMTPATNCSVLFTSLNDRLIITSDL